MKIKKKEIKNSNIGKPKKNLSLILLLGILIIIIAGGIFFSLSQMFATETYYVLNQDVTAKTQITKEMLLPQETSKGTAPQNSLSLGDVQSGSVYAKYPLYQGDVISSSNAGSITNNFDGVPDSWVITSFTISSNNAVDGAIKRGDYFDVIDTTNSPEGNWDGNYLLTDVLVLDVTTSTASTTDEDGTEKVSGTDLIYTVGLPQEVAPSLISAFNNSDKDAVAIVRSPIAKRYDERKIDNISGQRTEALNTSSNELMDLYEGTDPTFAPVVRDTNSRPVNQENCDKDKIEPANLCKINGFEKSDNSNNSSDDSSTSNSNTETSSKKTTK